MEAFTANIAVGHQFRHFSKGFQGIDSMASVRRQALTLAFATVAYNILEAVVAMIGARQSGSVSLLGFGLDSLVESLSGLIIVWRFWKFPVTETSEEFEAVEHRAAKLIAYTFFGLGAYVSVDAVLALYHREIPETSLLGIGIAIASIIVMPLLFLMKYRLAKSIGSKSLLADAKETLACLTLSVTLLIGLGAFYIWKIWWLDHMFAIVIGGLLVREGFETLEECEE